MARVQVELDEGTAARLDAARGKASRAAFVAAIVERGLLEGWTAVELLGGREAMLILAAMQSGATPEQIAEFKRSGFPDEVVARLGDAAERRELVRHGRRRLDPRRLLDRVAERECRRWVNRSEIAAGVSVPMPEGKIVFDVAEQR